MSIFAIFQLSETSDIDTTLTLPLRVTYGVFAILQALFATGYAYHYYKHKLNYYFWLATSATLATLDLSLAAVLPTEGPALIITTITGLLAMTTSLLVAFPVTCCLCCDWISSLKDSGLVRQGAKKITECLIFAFTVGFLGFMILVIKMQIFSHFHLITIIFATITCVVPVAFLILIIYLWFQVKNAPYMKPKKIQLMILFVLGLCCLLMFLLTGVLALVFRYLIWSFLTVWPGALVGFDVVARKQVV